MSCVQDVEQTLNVAIRTKDSKESVKIEEFDSFLSKSNPWFSRQDVSLRIKTSGIFASCKRESMQKWLNAFCENASP